MSGKLLSPGLNNPKTKKLAAELGITSVILHLAPASLSGYNACPFASMGCAAACLNTAGLGGVFKSIQDARVRKTRWFFEDRPGFLAQLVKELSALERKARRLGTRPVARLNGTSDILWELIPVSRDGQEYRNVMDAFPTITFYDYTKVVSRLRRPLPSNYLLTFSLSEGNDKHAQEALDRGFNVAAVIAGDKHNPPATWSSYPVVNGDEHDFRFLDPQGGHIIALYPKGKAKHDGSGFVRTVDATLDPTRRLNLAAQA